MRLSMSNGKTAKQSAFSIKIGILLTVTSITLIVLGLQNLIKGKPESSVEILFGLITLWHGIVLLKYIFGSEMRSGNEHPVEIRLQTIILYVVEIGGGILLVSNTAGWWIGLRLIAETAGGLTVLFSGLILIVAVIHLKK